MIVHSFAIIPIVSCVHPTRPSVGDNWRRYRTLSPPAFFNLSSGYTGRNEPSCARRCRHVCDVIRSPPCSVAVSRIANARELQKRINFLLLERRVNRILFELISTTMIPAIPRKVSRVNFTQDFTSLRVVKSRYVEHNLLSYPKRR